MAQYVRVVTGPTPEETRAFGDLLVLGAIGFGLYWLWQKVNQWSDLNEPYNYISGFYYFTIALPIKSFGFVWHWLERNDITPYPNLNFCICIIGIVTYAFVILIAIGLVVAILEKIGINIKVQKGIMFLPAVFAFFWFIISFIFSWLFNT